MMKAGKIRALLMSQFPAISYVLCADEQCASEFPLRSILSA